LAAVRLAAEPGARGIGVTVLLGDEIHAARFVRKTHTQSPAAFRSMPGPLGWVSEGKPRLLFHLPDLPEMALSARGDKRVALLTAALDDPGESLDWAVENGYSGIIVEALGAGHLPQRWAERIDHVAAAVPVGFSTRTGSGEILTSTYGFVGSESDLIARGAFPTGILDGPKARVLMTLLVNAGADREGVASAFRDFLNATTSTGA
jgi:L-asparaginase